MLKRPLAQAAVILTLAVAQGCSTKAVIDLFPAENAEPEGSRDPATDDADTTGSEGPGASDGSDAGPSALDAGITGGADTSDGDPGVEVPSLLHRYSFSEPGTVAYDSVGAAHGSLEGGVLIPATGDVVLDGVDDFVRLPSGMISPLHNATFMIWATWYGDTEWQRLWDFGNTLTTTDMRVQADRTFFLTPQQASATVNGPAAFLEFRGPFEGVAGHIYMIAQAETPIAPNVGHVFTVVIDEDAFMMSLYIDGVFTGGRSMLVGDAGVPFLLRDIDDVNNALGRSQYAIDPYLAAEINEFRIYGRALRASEVTTAYAAGADANPFP